MMVNYVLNHEHVFISVIFLYIKLMGEGLCEMIIFNSHMVSRTYWVETWKMLGTN